MEALTNLENILDNNLAVLKFNKSKAYSHIEAKYLLSTPYQNNDIYVFLSQKDNPKDNDNHYFCRSFFPKEYRDYTIDQTPCTLLLKEKITRSTKEKEILYCSEDQAKASEQEQSGENTTEVPGDSEQEQTDENITEASERSKQTLEGENTTEASGHSEQALEGENTTKTSEHTQLPFKYIAEAARQKANLHNATISKDKHNHSQQEEL